MPSASGVAVTGAAGAGAGAGVGAAAGAGAGSGAGALGAAGSDPEHAVKAMAKVAQTNRVQRVGMMFSPMDPVWMVRLS